MIPGGLGELLEASGELRRGHDVTASRRPASRVEGHVVADPLPEGAQRRVAGGGREPAELAGALADASRPVRVRGGRDRHAAGGEARQQPRRRVLLADGGAEARRGDLRRHPRGEGRLRHPLVALVERRRRGPAPGELHEVRVGQDVAGPRGGELLERLGVAAPDVLDTAPVPLGQTSLVVEEVELPRAEPVDGPEQHVEGVAVEEPRHRVHLAGVVVDLEADDDGEAGVAGLAGRRHVGVEIGRRVVVEVGAHRRGERRARLVQPEIPHRGPPLGEAEEVLGERDLADLLGGGPVTVDGEPLEALLRGLGPNRVRPEVDVVVDHGVMVGRRFQIPARPGRGRPAARTAGPADQGAPNPTRRSSAVPPTST